MFSVTIKTKRQTDSKLQTSTIQTTDSETSGMHSKLLDISDTKKIVFLIEYAIKNSMAQNTYQFPSDGTYNMNKIEK